MIAGHGGKSISTFFRCGLKPKGDYDCPHLQPLSLWERAISSLNLTDGCDGVISSNPVTLIRPNTDRGQKAPEPWQGLHHA